MHLFKKTLGLKQSQRDPRGKVSHERVPPPRICGEMEAFDSWFRGLGFRGLGRRVKGLRGLGFRVKG